MIAIGHRGIDNSGYYVVDEYLTPNSRGGTHIYRHRHSEDIKIWTKVGIKIEEEVDNDQLLGSTVSLSEDGSVVATAAAGHIEVYQRNDQDDWSELGTNIAESADTT
eukprot:62165_1